MPDKNRHSSTASKEVSATLVEQPHRSEVELMHSHELLESILDSIGAGVIVANTHGEFLLFNSMAKNLLGLGATETAPSEWAKVYGFYQADKKTLLSESANPLVRAMRGESVDKLEIYIRNQKIRSGRWCSVNVRPLLDSNGGKIGGVIVFEDVSEKKRLAEEVARSNRDLQQFAYVAAHDLQEPIRSIVGFADLLTVRLKDSLDQKSADQFTRINAAAKRMQNLVAALLAFARVETKAKAPELCDCNEALQDALDDLHAVIVKTKATVHSERLPIVVAERTQMTQLFQNLISNALKYRSDAPPAVKIKVSSDETMHHFSLTDNGMGFDMKYGERIFVIFQRLHNKCEYEGAGVGLALCKKIVERHCGQIWVESEPGKGTTIFFTMPVNNEGTDCD